MPASPGPSTPPLPDPRRHQLENGVSLVQIELPEAPVVCLDLWCRAGSACESEAESGLAHFLEHMVFKGSEQLDAGEFDLKVEALGGNSNAATGFDDVHYHVLIPPQAAPEALDLLLDLVLQPRLDGGDFAMERQVVLEELAQSEDQPEEVAFQELLRQACGSHAYGLPILGRRGALHTPTPAARTAALIASAEIAEHLVEDIGEAAGKIKTEIARAGTATTATAARRTVERGMAETIIGGAFFGVLEDVVGFADFLELLFSRLVPGVAIRVKLHGEFAIGFFQFVGIGRFAHAKRFIKILFSHVLP